MIHRNTLIKRSFEVNEDLSSLKCQQLLDCISFLADSKCRSFPKIKLRESHVHRENIPCILHLLSFSPYIGSLSCCRLLSIFIVMQLKYIHILIIIIAGSWKHKSKCFNRGNMMVKLCNTLWWHLSCIINLTNFCTTFCINKACVCDSVLSHCPTFHKTRGTISTAPSELPGNWKITHWENSGLSSAPDRTNSELFRSWTFWSPGYRDQPKAAAGPLFSTSNPCHQQAFLRASRRRSFTQQETAGLAALELGQHASQSYPVSVEYLTVQ